MLHCLIVNISQVWQTKYITITITVFIILEQAKYPRYFLLIVFPTYALQDKSGPSACWCFCVFLYSALMKFGDDSDTHFSLWFHSSAHLNHFLELYYQQNYSFVKVALMLGTPFHNFNAMDVIMFCLNFQCKSMLSFAFFFKVVLSHLSVDVDCSVFLHFFLLGIY